MLGAYLSYANKLRVWSDHTDRIHWLWLGRYPARVTIAKTRSGDSEPCDPRCDSDSRRTASVPIGLFLEKISDTGMARVDYTRGDLLSKIDSASGQSGIGYRSRGTSYPPRRGWWRVAYTVGVADHGSCRRDLHRYVAFGKSVSLIHSVCAVIIMTAYLAFILTGVVVNVLPHRRQHQNAH
jgi:hypothetical protein